MSIISILYHNANISIFDNLGRVSCVLLMFLSGTHPLNMFNKNEILNILSLDSSLVLLLLDVSLIIERNFFSKIFHPGHTCQKIH